jgi:hypothetical protein
MAGVLVSAQGFRNPSWITACKSVILCGAGRGCEMFRNQMIFECAHAQGAGVQSRLATRDQGDVNRAQGSGGDLVDTQGRGRDGKDCS